jgi:TonB family protein
VRFKFPTVAAFSAAAVVVFLPSSGSAQAPTSTPPAPTTAPPGAKVKATPPQMLPGGATPDYPVSEQAAGHQGVVWVSGLVQVDGTIADAKVVQSSGAPVLDQSLLKAFQSWKFTPARMPDGAPVAQRVRLHYDFFKDHVVNLKLKTCADFVADVRWYKAISPDKPVSSMRLYEMTSGAFVIEAMRRYGPDPKKVLDDHGRFDKAFNAAIDQCTAHPDALYLETLTKAYRRG